MTLQWASSFPYLLRDRRVWLPLLWFAWSQEEQGPWAGQCSPFWGLWAKVKPLFLLQLQLIVLMVFGMAGCKERYYSCGHSHFLPLSYIWACEGVPTSAYFPAGEKCAQPALGAWLPSPGSSIFFTHCGFFVVVVLVFWFFLCLLWTVAQAFKPSGSFLAQHWFSVDIFLQNSSSTPSSPHLPMGDLHSPLALLYSFSTSWGLPHYSDYSYASQSQSDLPLSLLAHVSRPLINFSLTF